MASKTFSSIVGGGGSNIIGSVEPKNVTTLLHTGEDASVWAKTGYLEPDIASYPNAPVNIGAITGFSNGFDTSTEVTNSGGISYDPVAKVFYVREGNIFEKYDENENYIGATADIVAGSVMTSVAAFVVYDNIIYAVEAGVIYTFNTIGVYQATLVHTFDFVTPNALSTMAYDPDTQTFIATQTSGLGGAIRLRYVSQKNGTSGILGTTAVLTGYTPYGVHIAFGKVFMSTYNSGADTNRIYSGEYTGPSPGSFSELLKFTQLTSAYDELYGITSKDNQLISSSRTTNTTVNIDANVGVGFATPQSINDNEQVFYYCKIK